MCICTDSLGSASVNGKVGEWLKPSVLKTDDPKGSGSSNLSLTAKRSDAE